MKYLDAGLYMYVVTYGWNGSSKMQIVKEPFSSGVAVFQSPATIAFLVMRSDVDDLRRNLDFCPTPHCRSQSNSAAD